MRANDYPPTPERDQRWREADWLSKAGLFSAAPYCGGASVESGQDTARRRCRKLDGIPDTASPVQALPPGQGEP
ncbi:MAG: hypothetical protein SF029_10870 [bacterium]|nr:hypothetical protein [bacterium]